VKETAGLLLTALLVLTIACDPGMTIRQTSSLGATNGAGVAVYVKTSHPLIGETWYAPEVKVTNSSDSPITVTRVELTTQRATYTNKPRSSGTYPLIVPPRETEALDIWFDLHDDVKKTFQQSAELRAHYRSSGKEEIAQSNIIGGPLNTSAP
jgi:hypothetical protein